MICNPMRRGFFLVIHIPHREGGDNQYSRGADLGGQELISNWSTDFRHSGLQCRTGVAPVW